MNPILNIAIRAIRVGGKIISQYYDSKNIECVTEKSKFLHCIYKIREKVFLSISSIIHQSYPKHSIINTCSKKKIIDDNYQWLVNPLNGTINFIKKIPHFCLSILIKEKNRICISVIYDPIKNDLFTAINGQGAQLNGFRARCCEYKDHVQNKIIAIYFKKKNIKNTYLYTSLTQQLLQEKISLRQTGCSILDLAYLSSGKINAYIGFNEKFVRIAFGELQIRESGALITDFLGGHNYIKNNMLLVGQANILKFILKKTRILNQKII
ncbi:Inositol-1-monophosphatase [Buchnera aphidicola (Cinara kochiana kochiana)]|uniref:Inositol-1-monophosphatase n=1 Tax=Buchnera aphidicola (Cinara kochiana kochiana) TaxID=2518976 RepID=A0A451D5G2_9GAMM|nr:inositol monophosphatase family protein [Buchnera aphidicola]VFP81100.1 Inositol-1-monophosphatase [Buchnera aphidicola (Cinara kochiana kochiana)]